MIETLRIENVAIVDRAELEFGPGLNVLTGETGAGKSIVLGALALLAGRRASADAVREGSDEAIVEAVFRTERLPELESFLVERDLGGEDHELVVRRTLTRSGRSRARLAGQLVPASVLAEVFAGRIEVSSQHDSQSLLRAEVHGELLDRMGGLLPTRRAVAEGFAALRAADVELERLAAEARERTRQQDFLGFQLREIDEAGLDPGAVEALRAERSRLAHAERLREESTAAAAALAGELSDAEGASAADRVAEAARRVEALVRLDPELATLAERLGALGSELREAALDLERYGDGVEGDPARLAAADERLHQVEGLLRKYGASVEEVLRFRDEAAAELAAILGADERAEALERQRAERSEALARAAEKLSTGRARAGRSLARVVQASLRELAMPKARFAVALEAAPRPAGMPCAATGLEAPEFQFSANAGEPLRPFRKVASGGELSRVFLAIKNALRETSAGMVLVFDEVDAGIGGAAADRVGRGLAELACHHQVLCITHLPQIAAVADSHFRVVKQTAAGRTSARISRVEGPERVEEIARMAGGEKVAEATREHARALLGSRAAPPPGS